MINAASVNRTEVTAIHEAEGLKKLEELLRESINRDFPERLSENIKENSQEDKRFLQQCENSVHMIDGHYCFDLPFRNVDPKMPINESQALERLSSLKRKLQKNEKFREDYTNFVNKILEKGYAEKGYAEKVPETDLGSCDTET